MRPFLSLVPLLFSLGSIMASDSLFYVGTYTNESRSKGIYLGRLNTETGMLSPPELAADAKNPSFVALTPDGRFLYAAFETQDGTVGSFRVESGGKLTPLNQQPSGGASPCHVWVDATGGNVLVANYGSGNIASFPVGPDGSLGEATASIQFPSSSSNPKSRPHAHGNYTDSTSHLVYSCDLGTDTVWIFRFDAVKGTLSPNDPSSAKVPAGAGPRHLAFHPNGKFAYVNNEMGLGVTAFARELTNGALTEIQTIAVLPAGTPREGVSTAEIACHPSGQWLYVSNRGHDSISVFSLGTDGTLSWAQNIPAHVKTPRGFAIDPTGKWMVVAGQGDDKISVLKIDPLTGKLTATDQTVEVGNPACVVFAPAQ